MGGNGAAWLFLAAALSTACGAGDESKPQQTLPVEIGTGLAGFEPVVDGQNVSVVGTPQGGGFRIVSALRVHAENAATVDVAFSARFKETGEAINEAVPQTLDLTETGPGVWEASNLANFVPEPGRVMGQELVVRAEVTRGRASGSDERVVIPE
jgi:hypothetical protein